MMCSGECILCVTFCLWFQEKTHLSSNLSVLLLACWHVVFQLVYVRIQQYLVQ